ncbi:MAG TPA: DEAD/DEAH box helicase [Maribacter sp.]|uniref:DEAD/DEAH box helicase n=1 Tax=Maribacter dokdonensis TaxID=320912 RepID=A0ABY0UCN2_9FLAO|nr:MULTISPECIES: DEAD/DEAH box helicase [Maribacter]APA65993.1 DEAD/DEAH box helicase [Maribacter sp. 1_2014MBL_MicDiv]KSA13768.1 ATP-dependent RNA helicase, DEAD box family protein [Maribacter dokdonensis DSW-8]MDP2524505.1 DEAD/DEAH box helicase [Maribacter dokdonensis]SDS41369.1 DEAD/DEAH box helicase [Maribacter dokdonensis]HAF76648.1 DEAD/DEAH box helicase [Maribacter sp.]|tara:strand:+ start:27196 stop:27807 length:612 start_codon:yes stop_codon:yes gene_type:complete
MAFKKLNPHLLERLTALAIEKPTSLQKKSIPVIKSGANVYCYGPKESGKTTALILTTLQKLQCKAEGNAPRAVVVVENKEKVLELYDKFFEYTKYTDMRLYASYKELHIDIQKSEIFEGIDVLITTPTTLHKLFLLNGVSTSQLKICSIDDGDFLIQKSDYTAMVTVSQSIRKCQYVLYAEKLSPKLERFEDFFMERAQYVSE